MSQSENTISTSGISATFLILTTLFFGLKLFKTHSPVDLDQPNFSIAWSIGFFVLLLLIEFFNNLSVAAQICNGSPQNAFTVFLYTLIPNFLVLGTVILLISILPGWLSPFSNTIGYFIVSCMGLSNQFNSLLKSPKSAGKAGPLITKIYSDKSLLINEMDATNYTTFMSRLSNIFVKNYTSLPAYRNLYALVVIKNTISEYIWYVLSGLLAISIGAHSISTLQCEYSPEEMQKTISQLHDEEAEILNEKENNKPVLYSKNN
jgi:hypothetical protein